MVCTVQSGKDSLEGVGDVMEGGRREERGRTDGLRDRVKVWSP